MRRRLRRSRKSGNMEFDSVSRGQSGNVCVGVHGPLAHLVEQVLCKHQVAGSSPVRSTRVRRSYSMKSGLPDQTSGSSSVMRAPDIV